MSRIQNSSEVSLVFHSLRQRLARYLPESSERAQVILQSGALFQVSYATVKNIPYALLSKEMGTNDLSHFISARVTYIEATVMALASTVCNLAFAFFYTGLSIATLGLSDTFNFGTRMHWRHVTYGAVSTGIGAVGVLLPYYGAGLNLLFLQATLNIMKACYGHDVHLFERPLLKEIQDIARNYSTIIFNYTREKVKNDLSYQEVHKPSLEHIERKIHEAQRMEDLIDLALKVRQQWPRVGFSEYTEIPSNSSKQLGSRAIHKHYE